MTTRETSTASEAARLTTPAWKIAVIPLLTIVFRWSLSTGDEESLEVATVAETSVEVESASSLDSSLALSELHREQFDVKPWPAIASETIAEFDPFSLSGELEQRSTVTPVPEKSQAVASIDEDQTEQQIQDSLSNLQLQGIFNGRNGPAALIDSRIVRIGDEINPGLRVVQITASGIIVEPVESL